MQLALSLFGMFSLVAAIIAGYALGQSFLKAITPGAILAGISYLLYFIGPKSWIPFPTTAPEMLMIGIATGILLGTIGWLSRKVVNAITRMLRSE